MTMKYYKKDKIIDKTSWNEFIENCIEMSFSHADILCESPLEEKVVKSLIIGLNKGQYSTIIPPADMFTTKIEYATKIQKTTFQMFENMDFWIFPNLPYEDGKIRPDITIVDRRKRKHIITLIECDSFKYHSTPEQLEKEKIRERKLMKLGYPILRFSGREITRTPSKVAEEIIKFVLKLK